MNISSITGCSTGFGRELAKHVIERGYRTVVTARNPAEVKDLAAKGEVLALKLDVTDRARSMRRSRPRKKNSAASTFS